MINNRALSGKILGKFHPDGSVACFRLFFKSFPLFSQPAPFLNLYGNCTLLEFYTGKRRKLLAGSFETYKFSITSRKQAGVLVPM